MTSGADRAAQAERSVVRSYVRRWNGVPGTALGRPWPAADRRRHEGGGWNYWWQAQLIDVLVDAELRAPRAARRRLINTITRSVRLRNGGWCNDFHDDMAWLLLALGRVQASVGRSHSRARRVLLAHLRGELDADGLLGWRCGDDFHNAPANLPTAIALARAGDVVGARAIADWAASTLLDDAGLVIDGIRADGSRVTDRYTYNQGVMLGVLVELAQAGPGGPWRSMARDLVEAIEKSSTRSGVLVGQGGGDGAMFAGICARYLAVAAVRLDLPFAAQIVRTSADAVWEQRDRATLRFPAEWTRPVGEEIDGVLSAQVSAWAVLEAAVVVDR